MKKNILLAVFFCSACATSTPLYTDMNGVTVYEARCDTNFLSLGNCYKKASEDCPFGFDVKDKVASEWVASRKLIYACRQPNAKKTNYRQTNYRY